MKTFLLTALTSLFFSSFLAHAQPSVSEGTKSTAPLINGAWSQAYHQDFPSPLSLEHLLYNLPKQSSQLFKARANAKVFSALSDIQESNNRTKLSLEGRLSKREFADEAQDHHALMLHLSKTLYDFGENDELVQSFNLQSLAQQFVQFHEIEAHKIRLMERFFDVVLADFQFRIDNEAMAIEFIAFDKTQDRHALGRVSDVDLVFAESEYQKALLRRSQAEQNQFKTRVYLANEIGFSEARPDELVMPDLKNYLARDSKLLNLNELHRSVVISHPLMKSMLKLIEAQQSKINSAKSFSKPELKTDVWMGPMSSYTDQREGYWRFDLSIDVPLVDGNFARASVAKEMAELDVLKAEYESTAQALRNQVTELYFDIKLLAAEKAKHQVFGDYADLYLDFSRALYENEVATDLGNSMVRLSQANYNLIEWNFKAALLWAKLDYLLGKQMEKMS